MDRRNVLKLLGLASVSFSLPAKAFEEIQFEPRYVLREEWGALSPKEDKLRILYTDLENFDVSMIDEFGVEGCFDRNVLSWFAIHHSGLNLKKTSVNLIQKNHMREKSDIAYNWVIDRKGRIYEGRLWFVMAAAMCPSEESLKQVEDFGELVNPEMSPNYGVLNVCLFGDFTKQRPTPEQRSSLYWLSRMVAREFPNVFRERIIGHRDGYLIGEERGVEVTDSCETRCPGEIEDVIAMAQAHFGLERQVYKEPGNKRKYEIYTDFRERSISVYG